MAPKISPKEKEHSCTYKIDMPLISQLALSPHQLHSQTKNRPSPQPASQKTQKQSPARPLLTAPKPTRYKLRENVFHLIQL